MIRGLVVVLVLCAVLCWIGWRATRDRSWRTAARVAFWSAAGIAVVALVLEVP